MKTIPLTRNKEAIVDDDCYEYLNRHKWLTQQSLIKTLSYACRRIGPFKNAWATSMHRTIMCPPANMEIDHINHNGLDNRRSNLRIVTRQQNAWNSRKNPSNKTGYIGVHKDPRCNSWQAIIKHNNKVLNLGSFKNPYDAAIAYDKAVNKYRDKFAYRNFPVFNTRQLKIQPLTDMQIWCMTLGVEQRYIDKYLNHKYWTNAAVERNPNIDAEIARIWYTERNRKDESEHYALLPDAMQRLSERDRKVIQCRFYDGLTLVEVGKQLGYTCERIRQIESKALHRLRRHIEHPQPVPPTHA